MRSDLHRSHANFEEEVIQPNLDLFCDKINEIEEIRQTREQDLLGKIANH